MLKRVGLTMRSIFLRRRLEREMQEEMAAHMDRAIERLMARGMTEAEARREAKREFGNVAYLQEEGRYARGGAWLEALVADLRFALRHFRRRPGTTLVILALLSLGIGINTLLFSIAESYATQPPQGIVRSDDLVRIRGSQTTLVGRFGRRFSLRELEEYRGLTTHFSAVAGWTNTGLMVRSGADGSAGLEARGVFVTDEYFPVLGVRPVLGPGLPLGGGDTASAEAVVVINDGVWERFFGRDPGVVGRAIEVNGVPFTIVGVAPPRFKGVDGDVADALIVWMQLGARSLVAPDDAPDAEVFGAAGRLREGVDAREATAATEVIAARTPPPTLTGLIAGGGDFNPALSLERPPSTDVVPLLSASGDPNFEQDVRLMYLAFAILGLLAVLVTSTNVAALLTALALARRREIAVRLSLGAARGRIIRQLLTESVLLATIAASLAFTVLWFALRAAVQMIPQLPLEVVLSGHTAAITFAAALGVGILFGLSPAMHATRLAISDALKDSAATMPAARGRAQRAMVVAQVASSQPLVVGLAAILLLVLGEYRRLSPAEQGDRIVSVQLIATGGDASAAVARSEPDSEARVRRRDTMARLRQRLEATRGVEGAVHYSGTALSFEGFVVHPDDRTPGGAEGSPPITAQMADDGYFGVMGLPLVRGREFDPGDAVPTRATVRSRPVVIDQDLARLLWPGADPLGRRLRLGDDHTTEQPTLTVVGVVDDPTPRREGDPYRAFVPPDRTILDLSLTVMVRTSGDARPMLATIRSVAEEAVPEMGIGSVRTLADIRAENRRILQIAVSALGGGAFLALFLSAIGLYAVVSFAVGQRSGEIAVRMAIGARARRIRSRYLVDGVRLSVYGLVIGLPLSLVALRYLLGLEPDLGTVPLPTVGAMAAAGALAVAAAASWLPARRAASIDPARVLRVD